jgi:hypothetical protein
MATNIIVRGATIQFATTFFDVNNNIVQPDNATINIVPSMTQVAVQVPMAPAGGGSVQWLAYWDTRNTPPGVVYWSVHTGTLDPIPVVAEDGMFTLTANPANLPTF